MGSSPTSADSAALAQLNEILGREGFEAFYAEDGHCYLRHVGTQTITVLSVNPHRPFSKVEQERRRLLGVLPREVVNG